MDRQVVRDVEQIRQTGLEPQAKALIALPRSNPYPTPPPYEKLVGDPAGHYSRRINRQHRIVYTIDDETRAVRVQSI